MIDSDRLAHEAFRPGSRLYARIRSLFPELRGRVSRPRVAKIVFKDSRRRRSLESLIHPYVFERIAGEIRRTRKRAAVVEVPLLFESGFHRHCDWTVVVRAKPEAVIERLRRKGFRTAQIRARWRAQMTPHAKVKQADFVIDNSKGKRRTRRQVEVLWPRLVSKTRKEPILEWRKIKTM